MDLEVLHNLANKDRSADLMGCLGCQTMDNLKMWRA